MFEDGVLNHLSIFTDLGRYCGTGYSKLVLSSLKLLEKLSASPKLSSSPSSGLGRGSDRNKALAALDDDAETISKILLCEIDSPLDNNQGPESDTYIIKIQILDFLNACLRTAPGRPTIAHLLLGFRCDNDSLSVDPDGPSAAVFLSFTRSWIWYLIPHISRRRRYLIVASVSELQGNASIEGTLVITYFVSYYNG